MLRSLILVSAVIGSLAFAAEKMETKTESAKTEVAKTGDRKIASVTSTQLAEKAYELADLMVGSLGKETANCDLNIYQSQVLDQVSFAHGVDEKAPVPARVQAYLAKHLGYRTLMSQADWRSKPAELQKLVAGTTMYVTAITQMLAGTIDFAADGTYTSTHGIFNDVKQDFDYVTVKGQWKILAPKSSDMKGLALVLHENGKSPKTRSYRIGFAGSDVGFVPGNRAKSSQSYEPMDLAFTGTDNGGCGD